MGVSTDAILVFGIDLGEELPEGWEERGTDPDEGFFAFDVFVAGVWDENVGWKERQAVVDKCPDRS
jgi:hypothetical protein